MTPHYRRTLSQSNFPSEKNAYIVKTVLEKLAAHQWQHVSLDKLSSEERNSFWQMVLKHFTIDPARLNDNSLRHLKLFRFVTEHKNGIYVHPIQINDHKTKMSKYFWLLKHKNPEYKYHVFGLNTELAGALDIAQNKNLCKYTYELTSEEMKSVFANTFKNYARSFPSIRNAKSTIRMLNDIYKIGFTLSKSVSCQGSVSCFDMPPLPSHSSSLKARFRQYFPNQTFTNTRFFDWDRNHLPGIELIKDWLINHGFASRESQNNNNNNNNNRNNNNTPSL